MSDTSSPIVTLAGQTEYQRWCIELDYAKKELEKFHERARKVTRRFLDERDAVEAGHKWFNLFYANVQILESALYAQLPKPAVSRTHLDYQDEIGRVASEIIQRSITQDLDDPTDHFDSMMRQCVQDRLVPGLAQAWLRLETDTEVIPEEELGSSVASAPGMQEAEAQTVEVTEEETPGPLEKITDQRVVIDYVFWNDFIFSPCRVWSERRWVGRYVYMSREELIKRFGAIKGNAVPLNARQFSGDITHQGSTPKNIALATARIAEIWDRTRRKVIWLCTDYSEILDEKDDPLGLSNFEPCPEPMLANLSTSSATPRPDYYMIQDQYEELDTVNQRLSLLIKACKVIGVYDKSATGLQRMLAEGFDNQLIPVDNWAMFAEKGGIKGQIDWLPLDAIVQTIQQLNMAREAIKGQIYELTGIADIVRGASKASETLGAQQIKAQFASVRIKKLQDEVARFASAVMRIKAEIIVRHFEPEFLVAKSGILLTDNKEWVEPAIALLKNATQFEWRIEITADTLAQADYAMEKADRIAFLTSISGYLQQAGAMVQSVPAAGPVLVGILKWAIAGFRNARDIEGMLDKALDGLSKQPEEKGPSPEEIKAKAESEKMQAELQAFQQKAAIEQQAAQAEEQRKEREAALDLQRQQMQMAMEQQRLQMEAAAQEREAAMTERMNQMKLMFEEALAAVKLQTARAQAEIKEDNAEKPRD